MTNISEVSNPFRVGAVFNRAWDIFTDSFGKFFVLALIPSLPVLILNFIPGATIQAGQVNPSFSGLVIFGIFLALVVSSLAHATLLYGTFQEIKGEAFSIGESLSVGFDRLFPVLGVSLLGAILTAFAAILLVIPALIVSCMLYVAIAVCVIERPGVTASLSRSRELTKGYRWQIFGIILVILFVSAILGGVGRYLSQMTGNHIVIVVVPFLIQIIATAFGGISSGVAYRDLRIAKEGIDTSKIANIFT